MLIVTAQDGNAVKRIREGGDFALEKATRPGTGSGSEYKPGSVWALDIGPTDVLSCTSLENGKRRITDYSVGAGPEKIEPHPVHT